MRWNASFPVKTIADRECPDCSLLQENARLSIDRRAFYAYSGNSLIEKGGDFHDGIARFGTGPGPPEARCGSTHPGIGAISLDHGEMLLYDVGYGTLVVTAIQGYPVRSGTCTGEVLGLHIHEGGACSGTAQEPFADAGGHYNRDNCPHPEHAGDLPPLLVGNGRAWGAVLTTRFRVEEVIGRTVIIHSQADDFRTQPAGDSGSRIACGVIRPVKQ